MKYEECEGLTLPEIVDYVLPESTDLSEVRKYAYELASTGRVHTYVRIKMPLEVFDKLLAEAKNDKNARLVGSIKHNSN